jgi:uncharacterized protein with GYD domain
MATEWQLPSNAISSPRICGMSRERQASLRDETGCGKIERLGQRKKRRPQMPTYIVLMNWTDQGAKTADQTVARYDAAKDDLAQGGVTIKDIYWTMGPYDIVTVVEAADDETASKGLMRLTSQGNLRSCTMRAFGVDEARSLME